MDHYIPLRKKLSDVECAYLAGLFDGEGTIGYYDYRNRHESTVMITNTDPRVMNWLLEKIGYGTVSTIRNTYNRRKHVVHHWRISNKPRVTDFLEAIQPYLIIKKDQADLLLNLWRLESTGKNRITPVLKKRRDETMRQLKLLKTSALELAS